jgi:Glycosyl hydrolases family 43
MSVLKTFLKNIHFELLHKQILLLFLLFLLTDLNLSFAQKQSVDKQSFEPAKLWLDNKNVPINAHGGGVLFHNGLYYWYGEHQIAGKSEANFADGGIHCYSSKDLINWTNSGVVMSVDYSDKTNSDIEYGCLIERPKVVYNKKTRKFIAFFKFYPKGNGYEVAYVGVAISDSPNGPFNYSHKFLGGSPKGSGDFSMFVDSNGDLYHLAVRKPDKTFIIGKMRDDYLLPLEEYKICQGIEAHTEAPAIIKVDNVYHMIGSGSSGWTPNAAKYYTSIDLFGPWTQHKNPTFGLNTIDNMGSEKTFGGQSSFIIQVMGLDNAYVAMFDIWKPAMPIEGRYIWLPIEFKENKISINWMDNWDLSVFKK